MHSVMSPLLGIIELEKDPPRFSDLWDWNKGLIQTWLTDAGGFAAIGLVIWILVVLLRTPPPTPGIERRPLISKLMWTFGAAALVAYVVALVLTILAGMNAPEAQTTIGPDGRPVVIPRPQTTLEWLQGWALAIAGLLAICGFAEPFVRDLFRLRWRRIGALAKLSFKEAIRRRVVWAFLAFLLIFLFPAKWFSQIKPEDELRRSISDIYYAMTPLLVLISLLVAAFSIPNDIKNQTIHTIVTKPVERFEIVLGRFFGYVGLLTIALFIMTTISLLMIQASNIDPLAVEETMKARLPVYGDLKYRSMRREGFTGVDVGREWAYRKYIPGGDASSPRALWTFVDVPSGLARRSEVPCEFAFDIYRTTKGEENRGVYCSFNVITWKWKNARAQEYEKAITEAFREEQRTYPVNVRAPGAGDDSPRARQRWEKINKIAEDFGRFEWRGLEVYDFHTSSIMLPPGLFKNALDGSPGADSTLETPEGKGRLQIQVKCDSPSQFLGVARKDLYVLEAEGSFALNFYKGALGLWCRLCIVILLAVSCSTYLAGVISFIVALVLFVLGYFQDFIASLGAGTNIGGGPFEAFTRLVRGDVPTAQLDPSPTVDVAQTLDIGYRWAIRRILNVIPDVDNYAWSDFVAKGFSIRPESILMNLLFLAAYLLPWAVLAYYLMRSREVAA
jgi:ABC-type transport system involved in multi-copper enzyme maturation permease subunit